MTLKVILRHGRTSRLPVDELKKSSRDCNHCIISYINSSISINNNVLFKYCSFYLHLCRVTFNLAWFLSAVRYVTLLFAKVRVKMINTLRSLSTSKNIVNLYLQ